MAKLNRTVPVTPEEIRSARLARGLSQTAAAALIGKSLGAWQKWEAPTASAQHRQMDAAYWELFQIKTQATNDEQTRSACTRKT